MDKKLKVCDGCSLSKVIWKSEGKKKFCKSCWMKKLPPKTIKKTATKISPRSQKRIIQDKQYSVLRKKFLQENPTCACGGVISGCTGSQPEYLTIQHIRGRVGSLYLDTRYWITLSLNCHQWVNEHSKEAIEMGLAAKRLNKD